MSLLSPGHSGGRIIPAVFPPSYLPKAIYPFILGKREIGDVIVLGHVSQIHVPRVRIYLVLFPSLFSTNTRYYLSDICIVGDTQITCGFCDSLRLSELALRMHLINCCYFWTFVENDTKINIGCTCNITRKLFGFRVEIEGGEVCFLFSQISHNFPAPVPASTFSHIERSFKCF